MELNPNHPVTSAMSDQWHKFVAILMHKWGATHVAISESDVATFIESPNNCVVVKDGENGDGCLHLRLVTMEEGERLARSEGGLPM